jgi:tetratricopeptide (TPR) repeat protein
MSITSSPSNEPIKVHFQAGRALIDPFTKEADADQKTRKAGISVHSNLAGRVLSIFGRAQKIQGFDTGKNRVVSFYVNRTDVNNWLHRHGIADIDPWQDPSWAGWSEPDLHRAIRSASSIATLTQQIQNDPQNPDLLAQRGELFKYHHNWNEAEKDFSKASSLSKDNKLRTNFLLQRIDCLWKIRSQNALEQIVKDSTELKKIEPNSTQPSDTPLFERERAYRALKQWDLALQDCNTLLQKNPDRAFYYEKRGDIYHQLGNLDAAIQDYTKSFELIPYKTTQKQRGKLYLENKMYQEAIKDFQDVGDREAKQLIKKAEAERNKGLEVDFKNGRAFIYPFTKDDSGIPTYNLIKGFFLHLAGKAVKLHDDKHNKDFYVAEKDARRWAIEHNGQTILEDTYVDTSGFLVPSYVTRKRPLNFVIGVVNQFIKRKNHLQAHPYANGYYQLGSDYLSFRSFSDAANCFTKAIELNPSEQEKTKYLAWRAEALEREGSLVSMAQAVKDYTELHQINPKMLNPTDSTDRRRPLERRAIIYQKLGIYNLALQDLDEVLKLDVDHDRNAIISRQEQIRQKMAAP